MQFAAHHNIEASTHLPKIAFDAVKILFKIDHVVLYPSFFQRPLFTNDNPMKLQRHEHDRHAYAWGPKKNMRRFRYFVHNIKICFL